GGFGECPKYPSTTMYDRQAFTDLELAFYRFFDKYAPTSVSTTTDFSFITPGSGITLANEMGLRRDPELFLKFYKELYTSAPGPQYGVLFGAVQSVNLTWGVPGDQKIYNLAFANGKDQYGISVSFKGLESFPYLPVLNSFTLSYGKGIPFPEAPFKGRYGAAIY